MTRVDNITIDLEVIYFHYCKLNVPLYTCKNAVLLMILLCLLSFHVSSFTKYSYSGSENSPTSRHHEQAGKSKSPLGLTVIALAEWNNESKGEGCFIAVDGQSESNFDIRLQVGLLKLVQY